MCHRLKYKCRYLALATRGPRIILRRAPWLTFLLCLLHSPEAVPQAGCGAVRFPYA